MSLYLIASVVFLLVGIGQFYRTRQSLWIAHIALGTLMVVLGVIGWVWYPAR